MAKVIKAADIFTPDGNASSLNPHSRSEFLPAQRLDPKPLPLVSAPDMDSLQSMPEVHERATSTKIYHESIHIKTQEHLQFVDLTDIIAELIRKSEIAYGFVNIHTRHTTAAIIVNENEPLLLEDMKEILESMAPQSRHYQHDNFAIRTANLCPEERVNGHSHCRAMFLGASETLNILDGRIQLGQWQRIFLVELDGSRERAVSVMIVGA